MIEIIPHQSRWAAEFAEIAMQLRAIVGEVALRIDHIGSTSVPGLAAKDIIDLMMTVRAFPEIERLAPALEALGFEYVPEYNADHPKAGRDSSAEQWEKRYFRQRPPRRKVNFHVRAAGRANQRYALLFRDYLRAAPEAAAGYEAVKRQLARYHRDDMDAYVDIKDPVCDIIMTGAEAWAVLTAWEPGPSDG